MKKIEKSRLLQGFSPFVIFGVSIILVPIFVLMTMDNIREQNGRTIEKLTGKALFLIRAFEAGTRTGIMTMSWGVSRVQNLLTETALQPEVEYMMITDIDGKILAHSDYEKVGKQYENMPDIKKMSNLNLKYSDSKTLNSDSKTLNSDSKTLNSDLIIWHRELISENGKKVFQVFKRFTPAHRRFRHGAPPRPFCMIDQENRCTEEMEGKIDWFRRHFFPVHPNMGIASEEQQNQIIFAALDMSEVDIAKEKYLRHVIAMGFMFFMLGCTGIVGILTLQGYRSAKTSISELKTEIERSRRLAAVGKLAAGVAHEIRNPLSSIKGFATYFRERYTNVEDDRQVADIMIQEVERLNRAVTQLLEFAKPLPIIKKKVNIIELVSHSIKLIEHDLTQKGIKVQIENRLNDNKLKDNDNKLNSNDNKLNNNNKLNRENIVTDCDKLNQILLNLYLNAMQAMNKNGKLTIKLSYYNRKKEITKISNTTNAEEGIILEVNDTGKGINTKDIEHIFDPYFTTRPDGTGLGLAMVHRAIEALNADIRVESKLEKGTSFFIAIPCEFNHC